MFGYGAAILSMLVVAGMTAASAWILREITNEFVIDKRIERVNMIALAVAVIFIVKGIANFVQAYFIPPIASLSANRKSPASISRMPAKSMFLITEFWNLGCAMPMSDPRTLIPKRRRR